jgi:hypothetical protein
MNTGKTVNDFEVGQNVKYIPNHAEDGSHPDCEDGQVASKNDKYVFVKFNSLNSHGQACDPSNLI